jgi:[acyl-carrier-protein] S-malonyltransferase
MDEPTTLDLKSCLSDAAFAFRGYNVTNLGRSPELLEHPAYGPVLERFLREASETCAEITGRRVNLVRRVRQRQDTTLATYHEALAMIIAVEMAQLQMLREFCGVEYRDAQLAFGYSLGEISTLVAGGVLAMSDAISVPVAMAADCVALAEDVTLGVLFSRGPELPHELIRRGCLEINLQARGAIGVSTFLSPNSVLLLGQSDTVDRFRDWIGEAWDERAYLRKNDNLWPPLHTPIVWQRNVQDRSELMMQTMTCKLARPQPTVLSMVTGEDSYDELNTREMLGKWIDHPQRLWDVVYETLQQGVATIVHVGPQPNLIPATFSRLADNVESQTRGSIHLRALANIVRRPWLNAVLPSRTALLRAPMIEHVVLEDWLLAQEVE